MVEQKPPPPAGPVDDFGIVLGLAYQAFVDQLRAALASHGFDDLGGAYGYVFHALADEHLSQRELARRLGITDQGMAKIVAEMVERAYVERRPDAVDSRVKRLHLAPRGRTALVAARRFHATFERQLENDVGPATARQLRRLLQAIVDRGPADEGSRARLRPT